MCLKDVKVNLNSITCFRTVVPFRTLVSRILTDRYYTEQNSKAVEKRKKILDGVIITAKEEIGSQFLISTYIQILKR